MGDADMPRSAAAATHETRNAASESDAWRLAY